MRCHFPTLVLTKSGSKGPDLRLSQHKAPLVDNLLFNYPSSVAQDPAKDNKKRCSTIEKKLAEQVFQGSFLTDICGGTYEGFYI